MINKNITILYNKMGGIKMSSFDKFDKKELIIPRTIEIEETFYFMLEKLSNEIYDASINKLVNAAIETLIEKENIQTYEKVGSIRLTRTFLLRESLLNGLYELKRKYGIPIYLLVNIAIRNALIEEGLIKWFIKLFNLDCEVLDLKILDKYLLKKEKTIQKKIDIDNSLYEALSEIANKKYDASINKIVNIAILELIETENINIYKKKENELSEPHSFLIRESSYLKLEKLREKYGISVCKLVNIAINNALNS